jgi:hypothetical protein
MEAVLNKNECFVIGAWIDTKEKEQNLLTVIKDLKLKGYPICLVTHCSISEEIQDLVDYYIYEKENILSENWRLTFWRNINGVREEKPSLVDYHGVACLMNIRNAIDLLLAKEQYKYIHYREADLEYDFDYYMNAFDDKKKALFVHYQDNKYRTDLFSVNIEWYNSIIPRVQSWEEYVTISNSGNLILEYWFSDQIEKVLNEDEIIFLPNLKIGNKWTQANFVDWDGDTRTILDFADAPSILFQSENRKESFIKALTILYKNKKINQNIVEIGVSRYDSNVSDGDSTSIWAWYISKYGGSYHGCDINKDHLKNCENTLHKYIGIGNDQSNTVAITSMDGLEFLNRYDYPIDLLYLDTIDWVKGDHTSGLYHLQLTLAIIDKLPVGGLIMFDDTFDNNTFEGKAELAIPYLLGCKRFTCIYRGYQFIFRKDI